MLRIGSLIVHPGERIFTLGTSGSGKTTLSRLIKGRLAPTAGRVRVLGVDLVAASPSERREMQRRTAMIDQEFFLVPGATIISNVLNGALGRVSSWRNLLGWYPAHEWAKAESILGEVELDGLGNRRVDTLSGGQRQRTAIARVLMQDANFILADEPVSNLDPELAEDALELLVACMLRRRETLMVNLHQPWLARKFATRIIGLSEGRVVFDGPPEALSARDEDLLYQASDRHEHDEAPPFHEPTPKTMAQ